MPKGLKGFQKGHGNIGTKEGRENQRLKMLGNNWNTGKHLPETTRKKQSEALKGSKSYLWKGGESKYYLSTKEKIAGRKRPEKCELCGREGRICFDHDHKTGKFRGWICQKCNSALGMIDDDIQTLELMIQYIKNSK